MEGSEEEGLEKVSYKWTKQVKMLGKLQLTWNEKQRRWFKKYKGRQYAFAGTTKEGSYAEALEWWERKRAEIDAESMTRKPIMTEIVSCKSRYIKNPLSSRPDICLEWDHEKNEGTPEDFSIGSFAKVNWKCLACHHRWPARILSRTGTNGTGCPSCATKKKATRRRIKASRTNPLTKFTDLMNEFDYELNNHNKIYPNQISAGSTLKVWWKCLRCENRWQASPGSRTGKGKSGCPRCNESKGEKQISSLLDVWTIYFETEKTFVGMTDKRELRCDFYLPGCNTIIEYQGEGHYFPIPFGSMSEEESKQKLIDNQRRDEIKRRYCKKHGIRLIEIRYDEDIEAKLRKELADCIPSLRKGTRSSTATVKRPSTKSKRKKSTSC